MIDMSVASEFKIAEKTLRSLNPEDRKRLKEICAQIQTAEKTLWHRAQPLLERCMAGCEGLCCRNINLEDIIGMEDFLYVLTVRPDLRDQIVRCLAHESIFSADCFFLEGGIGPCLFPADARPKVCIMTFCFDDTPVKKEIRQVGAEFNRLGRFVWLCRVRSIVRYLFPWTQATVQYR
ncbi:MAG: hypothetical protein JEZ11_16855 [Desulfobacterales bacterium]|nr:hypothetical protein [Desulfobacterales bacterium]